MPAVIDPSTIPVRRAPRGRWPRYDWPTIFDGRTHLFSESEVPGTIYDFGRQVRSAARLRGVRATVAARKGFGVYVTAHLDSEG